MASTINSDNGVSSGSAGLKESADSSGVLQLQTNGTAALTIDTSQNVGIGTASPDLYAGRSTMSINGSTGGIITLQANGTQKLRLFTGASSTVGTLTGALDIATGDASALTFGTNSAERMRIDSSGNLLVGTTTAGAGAGFATKLAVDAGAADTSIFKTSGGSSSAPIRSWNASTTTDGQFIAFATEASYTTRGTISYNRGAGLTAYNTTSDYRAKTVNGFVTNALSKVLALKPSVGRMNGAEYDIDFFVAHELQEVVPSAVTGEKDAVNEDGSPKYQMVDKSALIPLLTAAIQEQQALIIQLQADVAALKGKP